MRWPVIATLADLKAGEPGSTLLPPSGEMRHCSRLEAAGGSAALQWEPGTGSYEATLGWLAVVLWAPTGQGSLYKGNFGSKQRSLSF